MVVEIRLINSGKYLLRRDIKHLSGVLEIHYLDLNGGYIYMCTCVCIYMQYYLVRVLNFFHNRSPEVHVLCAAYVFLYFAFEPDPCIHWVSLRW